MDYIIVGNGLAGACLAWQLHQQGCTLAVFDVPSANRSSAIAAGLFNPVTGKLMKKSWQADVLFPYLQHFYHQAEIALQRRFFYPVGMYRPFLSVAEQNEWMALSAEPAMKKYVHVVLEQQDRLQTRDLHGGLMLPAAGYVDVPELLEGVRALVRERHSYHEEKLVAEEVVFDAGGVHYRHVHARKIIFCEGLAARQNPWLEKLPVNPLKGEVLLVEANLPTGPIINRGVYLVPQRVGNVFKVGATYHPRDTTETITTAAKAELAQQTEALLRIPFRVMGQDWGFRPTVPDRKPILGQHPWVEQIVVFNGLGTKGVSLAPYFSARLAAWLLAKETLPAEISMNRFYPLYSN